MNRIHNPSLDPAASAERVGLAATIGSVMSAFFGVQNSRARERDFSRGSPILFFVVALGLTAGFAILLVGVVQLLLHGAGAGAGAGAG